MKTPRDTSRSLPVSRLAGAGLALSLLAVLTHVKSLSATGGGMRAAISLGALIIVAWTAGDLFERIRLPRITGYVITGMLMGPYILKLIPAASVRTLKFVDKIALALIGIHAGQELNLRLLRRRLKDIVTLSLTVLGFTVIGTFLFILFWGHRFLPFLSGEPWSIVIVVAVIIAYLEGAKSPVTTIAVLDETGARGPVAETTLGAVIFKDLVMALLLGVIIVICGRISHLGDVQQGMLSPIFRFVMVSIVTGLVIGLAAGSILNFVRAHAFVLILGLALLLTILSDAFHLEVLLVGGAAGFVIENYSRKSEHFLEGLEQSTPFIYLLFFPVNGAALDLSLLGSLWQAAVVILALRFALVFSGVWVWARVGRDFPAMRRWGWMGFLNQESVTMALALILAHEFQRLGEPIRALMLAMVVITDLYAPALFKYALYKSGETRAAG